MKFTAVFATTTLLFSLVSGAVDISLWNYANQSAWALLSSSSCDGMRQSPINIQVAEVRESNDLEELIFSSGWDARVSGNLTNTGRSVKFLPDSTSASTTNHRGVYDVAQFHFHWGATNSAGSEHIVNGEQYSAEIHFVHARRDGDATDFSVVGVFCRVTDDAATGVWQTILNNTPTGLQAKESVAGIIFSDLLPENRDYYYYPGSLTTPLCGETVQWFVLKDTIEIPRSVLEAFRNVERDDQGAGLTTNFRETQDLNNRVVQTPGSGGAAIVGGSVVMVSMLAAALFLYFY